MEKIDKAQAPYFRQLHHLQETQHLFVLGARMIPIGIRSRAVALVITGSRIDRETTGSPYFEV
jgi:hypothetical protein